MWTTQSGHRFSEFKSPLGHQIQGLCPAETQGGGPLVSHSSASPAVAVAEAGRIGSFNTSAFHDIYNKGGDIDRALHPIIDEAVTKKAPLGAIIPGKGSGALRKHVLKFLDQKEIKAQYHRVEKDSKNFGRVFVHFRWK
jgi:hypothetical protein